jgi:DDE superfamily endonuclease/Tc5 transposase DNA-binding domain
MPQKNDESQIVLALRAMQNNPKLSARAAGKIYSINHEKLSRRRRGIQPRRDISANSRKLTNLEESVLVQYILDLSTKGFPPRLSVVEDMANRLLATRNQLRVGKHWVSNFIKRRPELRTRFQHKYDYQRAKCEDPEVIRGWFNLVRNTIAKYGIQDADIYNFDETGFMMGVISTGMVVTSSDGRAKAKRVQPGNREWVTVIQGVNSQGWTVPPFIIVAGKNHLASWYQNSGFPPDWVISVSENGWTTNERGMDWIRHFEKHTRARTVGGYRLLVLDGHESHHSDEFEEYCKENNIITLCMPPHSSHLLQPLDVGCFGPLKKAYGRQIEDMMRAHILHITKDDFFPAFHAAFKETITESNVQGGFRGAGLLPLDPEKVISALDLKLKTPTPPNSRPSTAQPWVSQTPNNLIEASSQTTFIKTRIARHQNSSPTSIYEAVDHFAKGASKIMHKFALLKAENQSLRQANEELSKRRRAKKIRLRQGGSLSQQEAQVLQDERDVEQQVKQEVRASSGRKPREETRARRCGNCNATGHNMRTCQIVVETSEEEDSE